MSKEIAKYLNILILDDEKRVREELDEFLTANNYLVFQAALPSRAFRIVEQHNIDIAILDIKLPETDGLTVLKKMKKSFPDMEIIMITGHGHMESVIQALRLGASDYFTKPFRLTDVQGAIERTRKFINLNKKLREVEFNYDLLAKAFHKQLEYKIIGSSSVMTSVINLMGKVAQSDGTTVLITGESGTGKELVAKGIHNLSPRKNKCFYSVNISAIPANLFESELFGHKKGAFTGAYEDKIGCFEIAHNGTLFLDEICDVEMNLQVKLLRVLDEKIVRKIGSHKEIPVNVRVVTATNKPVKEMIEANKFRTDLYHRLNTFEIHLPPLRERKEDIPLLLENFVNFYSQQINHSIRTIDDSVIKELMNYDFPGNIRELKNMAERAVILCEDDKLYLRHFPFSGFHQSVTAESETQTFDLELAEKNLILKALEKSNYNKSKASELLNISWQSLDRRIKKFGLSDFFNK